MSAYIPTYPACRFPASEAKRSQPSAAFGFQNSQTTRNGTPIDALELSKEEPQLLILNDVLVNTAPVHQERVLHYLQQISTEVQTQVLTCHSSMYRGVGHAASLDAGVAS